LGDAVKAVGYGDDEANEAIRLSGCHLTPEVEWDAVAERVKALRCNASCFGSLGVSWPKISDNAVPRVADAPLDVGFVHEFRTLEKLASFREGRTDGMIVSEAFGSAAFVKEVHNGAIQVTFDQVVVAFVAGFVHREREIGNMTDYAKNLESRLHKLEARLLGKIQAISWIDDGTDHRRSPDLSGIRFREQCGPRKRPGWVILPEIGS
jgi:hypothetical protein